VVVAIYLIELSGASVPSVSNGEIKAVISIFYAVYLQGIPGPQINRYLGILSHIGENGHSVHGPVVVNDQKAIAIAFAVANVGSGFGAACLFGIYVRDTSRRLDRLIFFNVGRRCIVFRSNGIAGSFCRCKEA
jgi:hypothetical protein